MLKPAASGATDLKKTDIQSVAMMHVKQLEFDLQRGIQLTKDDMSRAHLEDCLYRIQTADERR